MRKPQFFDNFIWYRNEILAYNELILHTNAVGNLIKPMLCFHSPKTSESQKFSDILNRFRKEIST